MTAQLKRFDIHDDAQQIIEAIDQDGGVIVENFISDYLLARLIEELKPFSDGFDPGMEGGTAKEFFSGSQTKRFTGLAKRAPSFAEVIDRDLLHQWAEHGFRNDYWLNTAQAMIVGPGSTAQMQHRDAGNWPIMIEMGSKGPEAMLSAMIAITDFTEENGATRVVPGSHRWDDFNRQAVESEVVQAVMPAGSALLYTGKTIHGAGANISSNSWRFGIHISFALAQLTPEEAHTVTVPWEVAKNFSTRVQHMLGYCSHRTFLPDWPALWTYDYRDVRETLNPAPQDNYVSAGAKLLQPINTDNLILENL